MAKDIIQTNVRRNEIASAIRYLADNRSIKRKEVDLRGVADHLMSWANLVFAGLVIGQAFSDKFNWQMASMGVVGFLAAYIVGIILYVMTKGGEGQ